MNGCYQNSVRKGITENSNTAYGGVYVTFNPDCLDAGQSITITLPKPSVDGHGTWTFTATFKANEGDQAGTRTKTIETATLACDAGYYKRDGGTANSTYDDQCLPTHWVITRDWYGCTASPYW